MLGLLYPSKSYYPERILVPNGYIGWIFIFYDQKNGEIEKYEDGRRLYKIPANGILKTKFKDNEGWMDNREIRQVYYVDTHQVKVRKIYVEYMEEDNKRFSTEMRDSITAKPFSGGEAYSIYIDTLKNYIKNYDKIFSDGTPFPLKHNKIK